MIRAPIGDSSYWKKWISYIEEAIDNRNTALIKSSNCGYEAQFLFDQSFYILRSMLMHYSSGDSVHSLPKNFEPLLVAWEKSNLRIDEIARSDGFTPKRDWIFDFHNLNHYNLCFWLIGLALALDIPDDQWQRLLALIDNEGQDILLDRIIATRQPGRCIGKKLLHPQPYARLLRAIDARASQQPTLLREFVLNWYPELRRERSEELWWYVYGDPVIHPLESGSYFGRWCIEAVAAVKAFGLDDRLCLGNVHYPGDLLRPDGPTTHVGRTDPKPRRRFAARLAKFMQPLPAPAPLRRMSRRRLPP